MLVGKREAVRWSATEQEILIHMTPNEAMEMHLDGYVFKGFQPSTPEELRVCLRDIGDVVVQGYAQLEISPKDVGNNALDSIDDCFCELMDPDGDATVWSEATKAAAREFGKAVLRDFYVWAMEPITSVTFNALAWAEEHEPQWFQPKEKNCPACFGIGSTSFEGAASRVCTDCGGSGAAKKEESADGDEEPTTAHPVDNRELPEEA